MTDYNNKNTNQKVKLPFGQKGNITFKEAIEDFPNYLKIERKSESTMKAYMSDLKLFNAFLQVNLNNKIRYVNLITPTETMQYKDYLLEEVDKNIIALNTAWRRFNSLKTFFKYLGKVEYAKNILFDDKFGNKDWKNTNEDTFLPNYLSTTDIKTIIEPIKDTMSKNMYRDAAMFQVLANYGCRRSEVLILRWSDVDFYNKTIKITRIKTNNADILPLNKNVEDALYKYMQTIQRTPIGYIFSTKKGKVIAKNTFNTAVRKYIDKFLKTNNFNYIIWITIFTLFLGTIGIHFAEGTSIGNSLWWSFVTITTVGYGDISPTTSLGRIIAGIIMLVGIGFLGILTATIATFFLKKNYSTSFKSQTIEDIKTRLDNFDELNIEDINNIYNVLVALKK